MDETFTEVRRTVVRFVRERVLPREQAREAVAELDEVLTAHAADLPPRKWRELAALPD